MMQEFKAYARHVLHTTKSAVTWFLFSILCGALIGTVSAAFAKLIALATGFRMTHGEIIYFLPLAGLLIIFIYHKANVVTSRGTNLVIHSIRHDEPIPFRMAPLIFVSTVITHLFGGSSGREGAALQIGGSLGNFLAEKLKMTSAESARRRSIMVGMSASFSALFGTPLAATILPLEISTVGIVYYSSFMPCAIASLIAHYIAGLFGLKSEAVSLDLPAFDLRLFAFITILAALSGIVSVLFCVSMHRANQYMPKLIKNPYVRVFAGGAVIVLLTFLVGSQTYNGTGSDIIAACISGTVMEGSLPGYAFLLKILFTAITLSVGYKGGELVPTMFIGATLGHAFGVLTGIDPMLASCIGLGCCFCAVLNLPMTALLLCFEMFGFKAMPYFLYALAISYIFSGNYGLYKDQLIRYDKYGTGLIDKFTH